MAMVRDELHLGSLLSGRGISIDHSDRDSLFTVFLTWRDVQDSMLFDQLQSLLCFQSEALQVSRKTTMKAINFNAIANTFLMEGNGPVFLRDLHFAKRAVRMQCRQKNKK